MDTLEVNGVERPPQSSLKRSRSPEVKLAQLRKAGGVDDVLTDNLRSQKRYLSQAMATDIVRLNMAAPASPPPAVSMNHSSSMQTANDASMRSSSVEMLDDSCQIATPTSKRQHLSLELPDAAGPDVRSAQPHRLSDSSHISNGMVRPHTMTPQAQRFKDTHDKPPLSPSDPCYGMDLRKAALLRSLMLATEGTTSASNSERIKTRTVTKPKASRKSMRLQESRPQHPSDSASMDMDCISNRSSMSPDTASSNFLLSAPVADPALPRQVE
ncbi:hypothetical protein ABBQ38_004546 [Trebouxia sp. C0009 RCD-2024]